MEVCKTRMQLQGELLQSKPATATLTKAVSTATSSTIPTTSIPSAVSNATQSSTPTPARIYSSAIDCFAKTLKGEGIRGVQRGLGAAYIYQVLLNGSRLGFYEPFRKAISNAVGRNPEEQWAAGALMAGASSGVVGGE